MKVFLFILLFWQGAIGLDFSDPDLNAWIGFEQQRSIARLLRNVSPQGTVPGTVVASPSKDSPNYYFHWIRDASLTVDQLVSLYAQAQPPQQEIYLKEIRNFIALSRRQQLEPSVEGLGEPRYCTDGSVDTIPWSRPQYDGPALRALTLMHFLKIGSHADHAAILNIIRTDLEYVMQKWSTPCFDLWEELRGLHYYTQSVQYSALRLGHKVFKEQGDRKFARQLENTAMHMEPELSKYWDEKRGYIGASRELEVQGSYKAANLDTAIVLGALHSDPAFFSLVDDRLLATIITLENAFSNGYKINAGVDAPAIGRFTDDKYFGGNPWYMTTAAFAEFYYRTALSLAQLHSYPVTKNNLSFLNSAFNDHSSEKKDLRVGQSIAVNSSFGHQLIMSLVRKGDGFMSTLHKYIGSEGEMSEQFDRDAGVPLSAPDLTWSYASFLSAAKARHELSFYMR